MNGPSVLTIGHSNHTARHFLSLLRDLDVQRVIDVRSSPYSRFVHHFGRELLCHDLSSAGIAYTFEGAQLGGRPARREFYKNGRADYATIASVADFGAALDRVAELATRERCVLMCSEGDPLDCHRFLLVSRALAQRGVEICHVLPSGKVQSHRETEQRLLYATGLEQADLFAAGDALDKAYDRRAQVVSYTPAAT